MTNSRLNYGNMLRKVSFFNNLLYQVVIPGSQSHFKPKHIKSEYDSTTIVILGNHSSFFFSIIWNWVSSAFMDKGALSQTSMIFLAAAFLSLSVLCSSAFKMMQLVFSWQTSCLNSDCQNGYKMFVVGENLDNWIRSDAKDTREVREQCLYWVSVLFATVHSLFASRKYLLLHTERKLCFNIRKCSYRYCMGETLK